MNTDQADKVIGEYMGWVWDEANAEWRDYVDPQNLSGGTCPCGDPTKSLDALIPVWEKLEKIDERGWLEYAAFDFFGEYRLFWFGEKEGYYEPDNKHFKSEGKTIQEAACIATARCIQELSK